MASGTHAAGMRNATLHRDHLQWCLLVAIPFVLAFSAINFSLGLDDLSKVELLMAFTLAGLYWWTRQGSSLFWPKNLFVLHPAALFSLLFFQGGFSDIGFIWSFGFPFIACLSAGFRIGLVWTVIYALIIASLGLGAGDYIWQQMAYIGLAYLAFSLIAVYATLSREKLEALKESRLTDSTSRLKREEHALMAVAEDVTEGAKYEQDKIKLQPHLEQAQRLESLGVLAGGIAHDFNNLLAAIMGNAELAREKASDSLAVTEYLDNIEEAGDHAAELCKQMLAYAGKGSYKLEVLDANAIVKSMGKLIRASVSDNITMKIKLDSNLPGIEGDLAQMQQLILNFIVNSAEAIGNEPGEIKVTTGSRYVKRDLLDLLYNGRQLPEGEYVIIEVKDSGCGMDRVMQAKIFDPFFTTKNTGSGLGLSAVLGIVRGHYGAIQLFSAPGKGAAFRVFFPATNKQAREPEVSTVEINAWQGEGTVLIVDDDLRVRKVASTFIEQLHFDIITAEDGKEGVELFRSHHRNLAAVLMDMTMPVMGGLDAMTGMREINADVPIILVSGYSEVEAGSLISDNRPDAFLQKPFKAIDLKKALHEVLEKPSDKS